MRFDEEDDDPSPPIVASDPRNQGSTDALSTAPDCTAAVQRRKVIDRWTPEAASPYSTLTCSLFISELSAAAAEWKTARAESSSSCASSIEACAPRTKKDTAVSEDVALSTSIRDTIAFLAALQATAAAEGPGPEAFRSASAAASSWSESDARSHAFARRRHTRRKARSRSPTRSRSARIALYVTESSDSMASTASRRRPIVHGSREGDSRRSRNARRPTGVLQRFRRRTRLAAAVSVGSAAIADLLLLLLLLLFPSLTSSWRIASALMSMNQECSPSSSQSPSSLGADLGGWILETIVSLCS